MGGRCGTIFHHFLGIEPIPVGNLLIQGLISFLWPLHGGYHRPYSIYPEDKAGAGDERVRPGYAKPLGALA